MSLESRGPAGGHADAKSPMFSVLIACYGHEDYVTSSIESVWRQTNSDLEILAVDDGSPDRTGAILDALASRSPVPMRVLHVTNQGAPAAFNLAASQARGQYLALLNDDDEYLPVRLEAFGCVIGELGTYRWGFSGVLPIDPEGAEIDPASINDVRRRAIELSTRPVEARQEFLRVNSVVSSGNLVVSASAFADVNGFKPYRYGHDWDLALRLLATGEPFILRRPLYRYRIHANNTYREVLDGMGASLEAQESEAMWADHRAANRFGLGSPVAPLPASDAAEPVPARPVLGPDEAYAVRAALSALRLLRRIPPAYSLARWGMLTTREFARRARNRR